MNIQIDNILGSYLVYRTHDVAANQLKERLIMPTIKLGSSYDGILVGIVEFELLDENSEGEMVAKLYKSVPFGGVYDEEKNKGEVRVIWTLGQLNAVWKELLPILEDRYRVFASESTPNMMCFRHVYGSKKYLPI